MLREKPFFLLLQLLYALVTALTVTGIAGRFHLLPILVIAGFVFAVSVFLRRKLLPPLLIDQSTAVSAGVPGGTGQENIKLPKQSRFDFPTRIILVFLLLACFSFQLLEDFVGGQDARSHYLPMSRYLYSHHSYSSAWVNEDEPDGVVSKTGYPPLLYGLGGFVFLLTGQPRAEIASLIPGVFFLLFLLLLFSWCEESSRKSWLAGLCLLLSPLFIERSSWFFQEIPMVFSATLLFVLIWQYNRKKELHYLYYASVASALGMLSKYNGAFFTAFLLFFLLFRVQRNKAKLLLTFFLLHLPVLLWYGRNFLLFSNPVFPQLNLLTRDLLKQADIAALWEVAKGYGFHGWGQILLHLIFIPFLPLWLVICLRERKKLDCQYEMPVFYFFLFYFFVWLFAAPSHGFRFLMPFYGVALWQLSWLLGKKVPLLIDSLSRFLHRRWMLPVSVLGFLLFLGLQVIYVKIIFPDHVTPFRKGTEFLQTGGGAREKTKIFVDTDHGFRWYGNYVVYDPSELFFSRPFCQALTTGEYYSLFRQYGVQYVVNSPWNSPWEDSLYSSVANDGRHFSLIYNDDNGMRIWRLKE